MLVYQRVCCVHLACKWTHDFGIQEYERPCCLQRSGVPMQICIWTAADSVPLKIWMGPLKPGYSTPEVREDRITSFASRATMCRDLSLPRCVSHVQQSRWDSAHTVCTSTFRAHMYMFLHASWALRNANRLFDSQNNAASGAWHCLGERKRPKIETWTQIV